MKKRILSIVLCLTMVLSMAGCGKTATNNNKEEVDTAGLSEEEQWELEPAYSETIVYGFDGGICTSPIKMAELLGYYEEEGITNLEEAKMNGNTAEALGTGKVCAGTDHLAYLLGPALRGDNMVFTTSSQTGCKSLYVLEESDVKSTEDLIGKTVAVPMGIGSYDNNIAMRFFQKDNLDPTKVNYKAVQSDACVLAMQNGEIDAAILGDEFAYSLVQEGVIRYVRSITWDEDFLKEPCCMIAFNKQFFEENPITATKMSRAIRKAADWIQDNPEEAVQVMLDNGITSGEYEQCLTFCKAYNFSLPDEDTLNALKEVAEDYKEFEIIDPSLSTDEIVDTVWRPVLQ